MPTVCVVSFNRFCPVTEILSFSREQSGPEGSGFVHSSHTRNRVKGLAPSLLGCFMQRCLEEHNKSPCYCMSFGDPCVLQGGRSVPYIWINPCSSSPGFPFIGQVSYAEGQLASQLFCWEGGRNKKKSNSEIPIVPRTELMMLQRSFFFQTCSIPLRAGTSPTQHCCRHFACCSSVLEFTWQLFILATQKNSDCSLRWWRLVTHLRWTN